MVRVSWTAPPVARIPAFRSLSAPPRPSRSQRHHACVPPHPRRDLQGAADSSVLHDRVLWAVNTFGEVLAQVFITPLPVLKVGRRCRVCGSGRVY